MLLSTSQVFQAMLSNGYEINLDRDQADNGTRIRLLNRLRDVEAFFYFNDQTEQQVVENFAWEYCTHTQLDAIYGRSQDPTVSGRLAWS